MSLLESKIEASVQALAEAIRNLHGCEARWLESIFVKETYGDDVVWQGEVQLFSLLGHPTASFAYAWSHETTQGKRKFYAVLRQGPVDSPQAAVRVAIVAEYKERD